MARENVGLYSETADLATQDSEKAKVMNAFFVLVFINKIGLRDFQVPDKNWPERLQQRKCTLSGRESGQGILKQTDPWTLMGCTHFM